MDEVQLLIEELQSSDPVKRAGAANSLRCLRHPSSIPALERALLDHDPEVGAMALNALLSTDATNPSARRAFPEFLRHRKMRVRVDTVYTATELNPFPHEFFPLVLGRLEDKSPQVRLHTAGQLGQLAIKGFLTSKERDAAVAALIKCLDDPNDGVRQCAAGAIGEFGKDGAAAVPNLIASYEKHDDFRTRVSILGAFCTLQEAAAPAIPLLGEALMDKKRDIRSCAAGALARIGVATREVVTLLTNALRDSHSAVRNSAVIGLRNCGSAALPAIPELQRLLILEEGVSEYIFETIEIIRAAAASATENDLTIGNRIEDR